MTNFPKITICGVPELETIDLQNFTHIISVWDPVWKDRENHEEQFRRKLAQTTQSHFVYFDDIPTPMENRIEPNFQQIQEILDFAKSIESTSSVLIHCWAGISRSTAIAYAILCQVAGPDTETECLAYLRKIRPQAVPDSLIVTLAEIALGREGAMFAAYEDFISRLFISCADDEL